MNHDETRNEVKSNEVKANEAKVNETMSNEELRNEELLLSERKYRDANIGRYEVLDKVKALLLIPGTELATTQQVADYYEVDKNVIKVLYSRNKDELDEDGIFLKQYRDFLRLHDVTLKEKGQGYAIFTYEGGNDFKIAARGARAFSRRAILRVGMLLRDSKIAKEVRTQLLNIEEKTSNNTKTLDLNEEQKLMLEVGMAHASGNLEAVMIATTNMMAFKNRHIEKLTNAYDTLKESNKALANGILKWEDRSRINFGIRKLSSFTRATYGQLWNELYKQLKNKYHIDVKARTDKNFITTIKEHEWEYVIKCFSAMCEYFEQEPAEMFNDLEIK